MPGWKNYGNTTKNNEKELYMGIKTMLDDKKTYENYKKIIKERAEMFDLKKQVSKVEDLINEWFNKYYNTFI